MNTNKKNNPPRIGGFAFDWDVLLYLDGENNSTRATTLEDNVRSEMSNKLLAKVNGLHLEFLCKMLDGDTLTALRTVDNGIKINVSHTSRWRRSSQCSSHISVEPLLK